MHVDLPLPYFTDCAADLFHALVLFHFLERNGVDRLEPDEQCGASRFCHEVEQLAVLCDIRTHLGGPLEAEPEADHLPEELLCPSRVGGKVVVIEEDHA